MNGIRIKDFISEETSNYSKYWQKSNNDFTEKEVLTKPVRLRTIQEAAHYIIKNDPETAFTKTALRRLILKNEIPSVKIGAKYLVNLDIVLDYLNNRIIHVEKKTPRSGINPINKK